MSKTKHIIEARGYIDHADRIMTETYPLAKDPKLFIPALKLTKRGLELIGTARSEDILATITDVIDAYAERVVEFPRGEVLVFADEQMRTTTVSYEQVLVAITETKHAYTEAYP